MTILSYSTDYSAIYGYIHYPSIDFESSDVSLLQAVNDIYNADLDGKALIPVGKQVIWFILWQAIFYSPTLLNNTARFKSALPKYDIGSYEVSYRNQRTYGEFINYQAQRSLPCISTQYLLPQDYPGIYTPPTPIGEAELLALSFSDISSSLQGDSIWIQPSGVDKSAFIVDIIYQAEYLDVYPPFSIAEIPTL